MLSLKLHLCDFAGYIHAGRLTHSQGPLENTGLHETQFWQKQYPEKLQSSCLFCFFMYSLILY